MIPIDSRFCSYCAVDLRHSMEPFQLGGNADAETAVLDGRDRNHRTSRRGPDRTRVQSGGQRRRRIRHPILLIAAIFAISFIVRMILVNRTTPAAPAGDDSGSIAPPGTIAPPGGMRDARLAALRQALNEAGYRAVHVRMNGGVLEVWGTISDESDRANVRWMILQSTGIALFNDEMTVRDADAEP